MSKQPIQPYSDPFSLVYDAILREFDSHNLTFFNANSTRAFKPDTKGSSDFPRWELRPSAMQVSLGNTSCSSTINQDYSLGIHSGDLVLGKHFYPEEWRMIRALWSLQFGALEALEYMGRTFVQEVSILNIVKGISTTIEPTKATGWAALWAIRVTMNFDYATIMESET